MKFKNMIYQLKITKCQLSNFIFSFFILRLDPNYKLAYNGLGNIYIENQKYN